MNKFTSVPQNAPSAAPSFNNESPVAYSNLSLKYVKDGKARKEKVGYIRWLGSKDLHAQIVEICQDNPDAISEIFKDMIEVDFRLNEPASEGAVLDLSKYAKK